MADRRAKQASQTRHEIVVAARRLFAREGYSATTVGQIAEAAGVSVQTIYDSIGSKREIVRQLNDLIDEEGEVREVAGPIPRLKDPVAVLDVAVQISHNINERCADIVAAVYSAASVEPEMRAVQAESRQRHRDGCGRVAQRLASLGALRADVETGAAADVIAGLCDPQVARTFVLDYGWDWDRWHAWTLDALKSLLLVPAD